MARRLELTFSDRHAWALPISEAARADLYTGLAEVLGRDRAETLMSQLPRFDPGEVATKADLAALRADFTGLRGEFADLRAEVRDGLAAVNQRLDRFSLALLVGMFGLVAAMIGVIFTVA